MIGLQLLVFALVAVAITLLFVRRRDIADNKRLLITAIGGAAGFGLGMFLDNLALAIGLVVAAVCAVPWCITLRDRSHKRRMDDRMAPVMSLLTSGYIQSQDIVATVRDNLDRLPSPFRSYFERFLFDLDTVNSSITAGLYRLSMQYDHYRWREWCNTLAACQHDRGLMHTLPPIIEELNDVRRIDAEIQTEMTKEWHSFVLIAMITLGEIPLCYAVNAEWYQILTGTFGGKIVVLLTFAAVLTSALFVSKINKPFDGKRG